MINDETIKESATNLLRFYFFEIWEKYVRLKIYIESPDVQRKENNKSLYDHFLLVINHVENYLDDKVVPYIINCEPKNNFDSVDIFENAYRPLLKASNLFTSSLHRKLDVFSADQDVIYNYIRKIHLDTLSETTSPWLNEVPTIAYSNDYDYSESDLWRELAHDIRINRIGSLSYTDVNPVIKLPIVDSNSPLDSAFSFILSVISGMYNLHLI